MDDCIFCKIAEKIIPADVVYEDGEVLGFRDLNPQAPEHFIFIPKKHISTLNDLDAEDASLVGDIVFKIMETAKRLGISDEGYRTVINCNRAAGQEIFHLHVHVMGGRKFSWPPG